jgi:GPH family glycoside/pentoside/hexuronide:cation symporter
MASSRRKVRRPEQRKNTVVIIRRFYKEEKMKDQNVRTQASENKPVSKALKTFFGVGDAGFTMMTNVDNFYQNFFFTNIAKFSVGVVTTMTTVAEIIDVILSMFYGNLLNNSKPHKWGRYRSWLILTPWFVPIVFALQWFYIGNGVPAICLAMFALIVARIGWNIPYVASVTMINVAGKTPEDRVALSSTRMVWTCASSVLFSYVGPAVLALFAGILGETNSYAATAFCFACLMVAGFYAHFVMFKGYEPSYEEELAAWEVKKQELAEKKQQKDNVFSVLFGNIHLVSLLFACITKYGSQFLINGIAIYYFTYVTKNPALLASFMLASNLLAVVAAFLSKPAAIKLGARKLSVMCYYGMAIAGAIAFFGYKSTVVAVLAMSVMMFMINMTKAADPTLYAMCANHSSEKIGHNVTGTVMGLLNVPVKVGILFRSLIIGATLALIHFDASVDPSAATESFQHGIAAGFMLVPAIICLIGALLMTFGFRLKEDK